MKKLVLAILIGSAVSSVAWAESIKLTTIASATVDKVGGSEIPGLLFKFELPIELAGARIDVVYLRFKVETDTNQKTTGFLVRPMLSGWTSSSRVTALSDSASSRNHIDYGRVNFQDGTGEIEITQLVRAWQEGELENLGLLVYPAGKETAAVRLRNLPDGAKAELEIFYTPAEVAEQE